jgi:hypothetical protein
MLPRRQLAARLLAVAALAFSASWARVVTSDAVAARAGTIEMTSCSGFGDGGYDTDVNGMVWQGVDSAHFSTSDHCPQGGSFQILPSGVPKKGENVQWHTVTPPSIQIVHAVTPVNEVLIDPTSGDGWNASFFWNGGTQTIWPVNNCCGGMDYGAGINRWLGPSRWFGWQVTCSIATCGQPLQILDVRGVDLIAEDNTPPSLLALGSNNIWYQAGRWIRGPGWPASFSASDDSGICAMQAVIDGQGIPGPSAPSRNTHSWTQCPTPQTMGLTIDTTQYPNGALPLTLSAGDAASPANVSSPSETLQVDNTPVGLSLGGPTDASSSAGTQYINAIATAGPSGVAIACSLDGSPYQWHLGSSEQIPVTGLGTHQLLCYAQNGAIDPSGNPARTPTESWTLKIGLPTVMGVAFTRVVDALRCHRVPQRVKVPAHWVTVHRHHRPVHLHKRAHFRIVKITRCHARTARKRITVWKTVVRNGRKVHVKRTKLVRVVVLPHVVDYTTRRVRHGHATTVDGWLGTATGTALGGQPVEVLTAADNGLGKFRVAALVTTAANGSWSARLAPGPSRLVEAVYGGGPVTEGAVSAQVHLVVPAKVKLISISPPRVPWGGTVRIVGQLLGGYLPPGGALVRLRLGSGSTVTTYGVQEHVTGSGRFSTTYTFGIGDPRFFRTFWFQIASLPMGNFPWAPSNSGKQYVIVGGHPSIPRRPHDRAHRKRKRHRARWHRHR